MKFPKLNMEEVFIGAMLQFPLYFIVGWWILPIQLICGILWGLGGSENSSKLFRRLGVPLIVCMATYLTFHRLSIFIAMPFMIWLSPSYGADGWLFNLILELTLDHKKADFLCRGITYILYWLSFSLVLVFIK
jgi:hypothetical protein